MSFCDDLWSETRTLQDDIRQMPFNTRLADGSLPVDVFRGYIVQDAHYLEGFARALALAAAKAPDAASVAQLATSAAGAIAVERQLHAHYMGEFGVSAADFEATPMSCACDHYVSFLLASCGLEPFETAVAALLPCFWIYYEIGQDIAARASADNPYSAWIDTYSGEAFAESVAAMRGLVDRVADGGTKATQAKMHQAFARGSWHEWNFWDSAYRQTGWAMP